MKEKPRSRRPSIRSIKSCAALDVGALSRDNAYVRTLEVAAGVNLLHRSCQQAVSRYYREQLSLNLTRATKQEKQEKRLLPLQPAQFLLPRFNRRPAAGGHIEDIQK